MTDLCRDLDPYLAGDLSAADAERFERHALACAACDAGLALPADVADALSALSDASCPPDVLAAAQSAATDDWPQAWSRELRSWRKAPCPPDVLAAALKRTRRAADRGPAPRRPRQRRALAWTLAALVAVVGSWAALRPGPGEPAQVAQVSPAPPPATAVPDAGPRPQPAQPSPAPDAGSPTSPSAGAPPATAALRPPETQPAASAPRMPDPGPAREESGARPPDLAVTDPLGPDLAEREPSAQEIEDARRDLALAFALVADAQSAAGAHVREQAQALGSTLNNTSPF